jgi:hypothetical protein
MTLLIHFLFFPQPKMPKAWSKRFNNILQSKKSVWKEARNSSQKEAIIQEVVKAIRDQVEKSKSEDPAPPGLEKVSWIQCVDS